MKKILVICLILFSVFLIYLLNMDKKVYYLALGNSNKNILYNGMNVHGYSFYVDKYLKKNNKLEKYVYEFSNDDIRITDLINDLRNNKKVNEVTLKNALIKADLVTLNISINDIYDKLKQESVDYSFLYNYIDELLLDLDDLFKIMREYCKEDIILIGYYNPYKRLKNSDIDDVVDYLNRRYKEICTKYKVEFIDVSGIDVNNESLASVYESIADKVINRMNKVLF